MPQGRDNFVAILAVMMHRDLSGTDKSVAGVLLDHFNRTTGQCDPSLERIGVIIGISERTVIRSLNRLVALRLFRKDRHGGLWARNSYQPIWPAFTLELEKYKARKDVASKKTAVTNMSSASCQTRHDAGDNSVTLTFQNNLSNETFRDPASVETLVSGTNRHVEIGKEARLWEAVKETLAFTIGREHVECWFKGVVLRSLTTTDVVLEAPTAFVRSRIDRDYLNALNDAWCYLQPTIEAVEVVFVANTRGATNAKCSP